MTEEPRRRTERRRWTDGSVDLLADRVNRHGEDIRELRRRIEAVEDGCADDFRNIRELIDRILERLVAQPASGGGTAAKSGAREFFLYLIGTVAVLGATIGGILLAAPH